MMTEICVTSRQWLKTLKYFDTLSSQVWQKFTQRNADFLHQKTAIPMTSGYQSKAAILYMHTTVTDMLKMTSQ